MVFHNYCRRLLYCRFGQFRPDRWGLLGKGSTLAVQRARIWFYLAGSGEERKHSGAMSESVVFELKLQIQHLEEKLTFLAGGTNGAELVEVVMEKDEELEKNVRACLRACLRACRCGRRDRGWLSLIAATCCVLVCGALL